MFTTYTNNIYYYLTSKWCQIAGMWKGHFDWYLTLQFSYVAESTGIVTLFIGQVVT